MKINYFAIQTDNQTPLVIPDPANAADGQTVSLICATELEK